MVAACDDVRALRLGLQDRQQHPSCAVLRRRQGRRRPRGLRSRRRQRHALPVRNVVPALRRDVREPRAAEWSELRRQPDQRRQQRAVRRHDDPHDVPATRLRERHAGVLRAGHPESVSIRCPTVRADLRQPHHRDRRAMRRRRRDRELQCQLHEAGLRRRPHQHVLQARRNEPRELRQRRQQRRQSDCPTYNTSCLQRCSSNCRLFSPHEQICGDSIVDAGHETCDDGNTTNGVTECTYGPTSTACTCLPHVHARGVPVAEVRRRHDPSGSRAVRATEYIDL